MDRVGIRELQQNASACVRRVKEGESLEVTERGVVVAVLSPAAAAGLERLRREGLVTSATGRIADLPPPVSPPAGVTASRVLQEMRDEDER
jgi:prevent-host-death family protein